ncbi:MAG: NAD(P)H-dependent oxidoreductase subunit E [Desulfobacteraceae bacterium]|nr:MAG: NAD(P)H-dependent oxidoreductase subunit E [Desulfobacteraceae bacterium]
MEHYGVQIDEIIERYPEKPEYLIFLLQDIQSAYGYISAQAMQLACDRTGVPLTQGYSVATFYQSFRLDPSGEHAIRVCLGTACHLKGGQRLVEDLQRRLDVKAGETTADMRFTLNTVNCVGACALAPVVVVDDTYLANATSKKIEKHLKTIDQECVVQEKEAGHA